MHRKGTSSTAKELNSRGVKGYVLLCYYPGSKIVNGYLWE